ncbi:MAG: hypothetical protein KDA58_02860 [Planctomycetaceae bacterium]|nr:hypothetical protein [Planctomycetaceae bacterium]
MPMPPPSMPAASCSRSPMTLREMLLAALIGLALTVVFWWPLWLGGGLQGGDLYSYYMPQKVLLSESLAEGTIPLWNDRTGFGYPAAAESQTGVLYPPTLLLYWLFAPNTAYNISQLGHYVLAFVATWGLIRQLGLRAEAAALGALAFVYGWLPPRICLEWAVIGVSYFSIVLWCGIAWLQTGCPRSLGAMAIALGLSLLAGHFHLAFMTGLVIALLGAINFMRPCSVLAPDIVVPQPTARYRTWGLMLALAAGFSIAAIQLAPTWELRQVSQRQSAEGSFDPAYGHIPPVYLLELVAPWLWHVPDVSADAALSNASWGRYPAGTNMVEAHLYVGLIPFLLALAAMIWRTRGRLTIPVTPWLLLTAAGLLLVTGWPLIVLRHVPGFSFFQAPGRYGLLTSIGLAVLAANAWDGWGPELMKTAGQLRAVTAGLLLLTTCDLWALSREYVFDAGPMTGRQVFYAILLKDVPIEHLDEPSPTQQSLVTTPGARLYAPGANIPSLTGVSSLPVYLGLGPEIYFDPEMQIDFAALDEEQRRQVVERLQGWGVTHLLLQAPLPAGDDMFPFIGMVIEPLVNRALVRREPLYLYQVPEAAGRAQLSMDGEILEFDSLANQLRVKFSATSDGTLTLKDLAYPGWTADLDGVPVAWEAIDSFRRIDVPAGTHEVVWRFRPRSVLYGGMVSVLSLLIVVLVSWLQYRRHAAAQAC